MSSNDTILRFLFDKTDIRGEITLLEKSYQEAISHQDIPAPLKQLLGEFLAATVLVSQTLKFDGILTVQARGQGPVSLIMADVSNRGEVRCILQQNSEHEPVKDYTGLSLPELIGQGALSIIIEPKKGERYQGIVPLEHDTLAECLCHYFVQSEQLPTRMWLFSNGTKCGGLFLQCLPSQIVQDVEQRNEQWQTATQLAATIKQDELFDLNLEDCLYRLFNEFECRVFPEKPLKFRCKCSEEKTLDAVYSLGEKDARKLIAEQDVINIDCQFCGKKYIISEEKLDSVFNKKTIH